MGWARDMLFLGGYLSPAVLAEEIELERAAEAAAASRRAAQASTIAAAATTPAPAAQVARGAVAPLRPCA